MKKISLTEMIEAAFFAVFAVILDLLPSIKLSPSISISIAMVPIFLIAFRRGARVGFISGFIWEMLQIIMGDAWMVTPVQAILEYLFAFAFIGCAGLFYPLIQKNLQNGHKQKMIGWVIIGVFVGSLARYFWHFLAGVFFFASYAPKGMSPVLFSFLANGATMLGSAVLCSIVLVLLISAAPRLIVQKGPHSKTPY